MHGLETIKKLNKRTYQRHLKRHDNKVVVRRTQEEIAIDRLTDLIHYCNRHELDLEAIGDTAFKHFEHEKGGN